MCTNCNQTNKITKKKPDDFFWQISPKPQKKQQPQPQQQLASLVELAKKKAEVTGSTQQDDANQVQIVAGSADKGGARQVDVNAEKTSDVAKTSPGNLLRRMFSLICYLEEVKHMYVHVSRVFTMLQLLEFENQARCPSWRIYPVEAKVPQLRPTSWTFHRYHLVETKWCLHPEVMKLTLKLITCFVQKFGRALQNIANNLPNFCLPQGLLPIASILQEAGIKNPGHPTSRPTTPINRPVSQPNTPSNSRPNTPSLTPNKGKLQSLVFVCSGTSHTVCYLLLARAPHFVGVSLTR